MSVKKAEQVQGGVALLGLFAWKQNHFVWERKHFAWKQSLFVWKQSLFVWKQKRFVWKQNLVVPKETPFAAKQKGLVCKLNGLAGKLSVVFPFTRRFFGWQGFCIDPPRTDDSAGLLFGGLPGSSTVKQKQTVSEFALSRAQTTRPVLGVASLLARAIRIGMLQTTERQ